MKNKDLTQFRIWDLLKTPSMDKTGETHEKKQDELDTKLIFCKANVKK